MDVYKMADMVMKIPFFTDVAGDWQYLGKGAEKNLVQSMVFCKNLPLPTP